MPRGSFANTPTNNKPTNDLPTLVLIPGTPEQEAIWDALLHTDKHVIVEATAGSGKTFVITQYAMREKSARVGLVAFNKHIATELTERMGGQANVECMTYHSLGFRACKAAFGYLGRPDEYKVLGLLDQMSLTVPEKQEKVVKYKIKQVVGLAKSYGLSPGQKDLRERLEGLIDHHDVDLNGLHEVVMDTVPKVLAKCRAVKKGESIDFDDMVWLPMELGLSVPRFDVLCVDEYQDTGLTQQWLALQAAGRLCAVGDPRQAIYGFRGADSEGFDRLRKKLGAGVLTLPLTLTRRCPKSHVRLAQQLVPQIRAMETAPEGVVRVAPSLDAAVAEMRAGDLVVCRVNAELIGVAYKLLKRGVKAIVRGKDIGKGMVKLIEQAEGRVGRGSKLAEVLTCAGEITSEAVAKFNAIPHGRGEMRAMNAQDRYDCVCELAEGVESVAGLVAVIDRLFGDFDADGTPKNAVVLGTVHRTKGLEGGRVFVLRPDLIPHPAAKKKHDQLQERNLLYVACTRSKYSAEGPGELIFVGGMCAVFGEGAKESSEPVNFTNYMDAEFGYSKFPDEYPNEGPREEADEEDGTTGPEWEL